MSAAIAPAKDEERRLEQIDWSRVAKDLDAQGSAVIELLLAPGECRSLAELYPDDAAFRSRVAMARHGFAAGPGRQRLERGDGHGLALPRSSR